MAAARTSLRSSLRGQSTPALPLDAMADEAGSYAGTLDLTGGVAAADHRHHPDSSHKYATMHQYRFHILAGLVFVLDIIAIALGASSVARSNEALRLAESHERAMAELAATASAQSVAVDDSGAGGVPVPAPGPVGDGGATQVDAPVADDGGAAQDDTSAVDASPPVPAPDATPAVPVADSASAIAGTFSPTNPHPLNPKWFHTDHEHYQTIVQHDGNAQFHSHLHAGMFCHRQSLHLCPYEVYCPNGQGTRPYGGGPPEFTPYKTDQPKQWAPYLIGDDPADRPDGEAGVWVQVGIVPEVDGGYAGNGFGQCWTWDAWMMGGGGDIEKTSSDEYRQWILCCEASS